MTGPVVQSHGPDGLIFDELALKRLECEHDLCFGKEKHRYPAMQGQRVEGLAQMVLALVREVRSLRAQLAEKKAT
jgi:hypothetical protein